MASTWRYSVTLIDSKAIKTTLNYEGLFSGLSLEDEFGLAQTAAADMKAALLDITDALVYREALAYQIGGGTSLPADADVTDELAIIAFLTADDVAPEYATLRVPAPVDAVWESDGITLDKTNADVIAYVALFDLPDNGFQVSDGQYVETDNQDGISSGHWRSKAKSTRKGV